MHTFFFLLKLLHAIDKILPNKLENRKNKDTWFDLLFVKIRYYRDKVSSWEFCIKNIEFKFKIFRMEIFHIYNLKSKDRTRLSSIALFSFGFQKKPPKNLSSK